MTIKELRTSKNLTQEVFAKSIGVSVISVRAYEAGRTKPGAKILSKIKEEYGVDVELTAAEAAPKAAAKAAKAEKKPVQEKAPVTEEKAPAPKKAIEKKPVAKKAAAVKKAEAPAEVIIQSPLGGEITPADILAKVGSADKIYVRVDENKAYWVRGEETGSVDLW